MPRRKGTPKTGGRKKGTPNKASLPIEEICEAKGLSPTEVLIDFLKSKDPAFKFQAAKELTQYLYPNEKPSNSQEKSQTPRVSYLMTNLIAEFNRS